MSYEIPIPVEGCASCQMTGGVYSCPKHSPNIYVRESPTIKARKDFVQIYIRCPWCGKDMQFDGYKLDPLPKRND